MDADTLIKVIVDNHENIYGGDKGDKLYNNAVKRMSTVDLANIDEALVRDVVEPFLNVWGKMGRVLGQKRFSGWQGKATEIIKSNSDILKQFQNRTIEKENLTNNKNETVTLYESFKEATGPIASAKILHVICPHFFPLWDNAIANAFRAELANLGGYRLNKSVKIFSGEDYFRFMEGIKLFMSRHNDIISHLSNQFRRGKLRIIDECFWQTVRRPFFHIF